MNIVSPACAFIGGKNHSANGGQKHHREPSSVHDKSKSEQDQDQFPAVYSESQSLTSLLEIYNSFKCDWNRKQCKFA